MLSVLNRGGRAAHSYRNGLHWWLVKIPELRKDVFTKPCSNSPTQGEVSGKSSTLKNVPVFRGLGGMANGAHGGRPQAWIRAEEEIVIAGLFYA